MRRLLTLALPVLLLASCGVNEEKWPEKSAKATCKFSEKCATANFYATYDDMGACIDENELALQTEATEKTANGCVYDDDQAKECLKALGAGCKTAGEESETLFDPCLRVWNCGTGTGTTGGDTGT